MNIAIMFKNTFIHLLPTKNLPKIQHLILPVTLKKPSGPVLDMDSINTFHQTGLAKPVNVK